MGSQKAWDRYEAAILLEALIQVKEGTVLRKEAIESVSKKLRKKAKVEGFEIDEIFRNVAGITFQMHSMESAYVGMTLIKPATKLFSEIAALQKENPVEYNCLLEGAYKMIDTNESMEKKFFTWLSNRVSSAQLSELYTVYKPIEKFCLDKGIIRLQLLETTDLSRLAKVQETVTENHIFRFIHKRQANKMAIGIGYYIDFLKELKLKEEEERKKSEQAEVEIPLVKNEKDTNLIIQDRILSKQEIEQRKQEFIDWMMEQEMADRTAMTYASSCGLAGKVAQDYGIVENDIWTISDADVLKEAFNKLLRNQEFVEKNESRHNQFSASMAKYIQFCGDENFNSRGSYDMFIRHISEYSVEDEDIKNINPELYMRLRSISKVYDDPNGLSIERIRTMVGVEIEREELKDILDRIPWITEVDNDIYSCSKSAKPYENQIEFDKGSFVRVLMMRYRGGMRFDSIDLENFRETYNDIVDEMIDLSDKDLEVCLRKCGIMWQNRLFPTEGILDNSAKEKVLAYINENFNNGKKVLYYKAIYSDLAEVFVYCFNLTEAMMLKPYLEYVCDPEEYYFFQEYMAKEKNVSVDHSSEIEEFLLSVGKPLSYDEIYAGLSHVSKEVIYSEIKTNRSIILNEKEHYYHFDLFEFSSEDADQITMFINDEIAKEGYCIWSRVYNRVKSEMLLFIENNTYLSNLGIRNAVAKKLSGRFNFESEVICSRGNYLNMSAVYTLFGEHHAPFSDDELYEFAKEVSGVTTPAYLDALAESTVRVSKNLFVAKDQIEFDIEAIDKALSTYLTTGYMLIKDVDSFLVFPNVGFEWNSFLLESYLMYYSKDYALCNNGKSLNNVAGALVKKGSAYDDFEDICADALANGYVELTKNKALDFLADQNLLTRRSYVAIDRAITKAKQIRNKKG